MRRPLITTSSPPRPLTLRDVCRLQMAHPEVDTRSIRLQYRLVREALPDCLTDPQEGKCDETP